MVFKGEINPSKQAYILYLAHDKKLLVHEIVQQCKVSRATAYRITKTNLMEEKRHDKKHAGGWPKKLRAREERKIIRTLKCLRQEEGNFSSIQLMSGCWWGGGRICSISWHWRHTRNKTNRWNCLNSSVRGCSIVLNNPLFLVLENNRKMDRNYFVQVLVFI